jgi:hypothetical protein
MSILQPRIINMTDVRERNGQSRKNQCPHMAQFATRSRHCPSTMHANPPTQARHTDQHFPEIKRHNNTDLAIDGSKRITHACVSAIACRHRRKLIDSEPKTSNQRPTPGENHAKNVAPETKF